MIGGITIEVAKSDLVLFSSTARTIVLGPGGDVDSRLIPAGWTVTRMEDGDMFYDSIKGLYLVTQATYDLIREHPSVTVAPHDTIRLRTV